jgi:hypothetical protein
MSVWIARDKDGDIWAYNGKPERYNGYFSKASVNDCCELDRKDYPWITFGNSPVEVKLDKDQ